VRFNPRKISMFRNSMKIDKHMSIRYMKFKLYFIIIFINNILTRNIFINKMILNKTTNKIPYIIHKIPYIRANIFTLRKLTFLKNFQNLT